MNPVIESCDTGIGPESRAGGTSSRRSFARMAFKAAFILAGIAVALFFGYQSLAINYRVYDDDGCFLLAFQHFFAGERLYSDVFSFYGPFYFLVHKLLFGLFRLPVSHDAGRFITLICWLFSTGLAWGFIYRISRNVFLASAAALACMVLTLVLVNEPDHPQQIIVPMLLAACWIAASRLDYRVQMILLGAIGSGLFLSKINVGVFYFAALGATLVYAL